MNGHASARAASVLQDRIGQRADLPQVQGCALRKETDAASLDVDIAAEAE